LLPLASLRQDGGYADNSDHSITMAQVREVPQVSLLGSLPREVITRHDFTDLLIHLNTYAAI